MCCRRFTLSASSRKEVERHLKTAQRLGYVRQGKSLLALLAGVEGQRVAQVAMVLHVPEKTVATWVRQKPTGRPPQRTPTPKAALATLMDEGPRQAGLRGAGWRSPMIPPLIYDRFGVFYNVFSIAQLLKHWGLSCQKAAWVSDHLDEDKRQAWRTATWPHLLRRAKARKALRLFGDEASCPQGGTRTDTWARRGQQPKGKTCGKRNGSKGFGLIDSFTGHFL
jgi:transposase